MRLLPLAALRRDREHQGSVLLLSAAPSSGRVSIPKCMKGVGNKRGVIIKRKEVFPVRCAANNYKHTWVSFLILTLTAILKSVNSGYCKEKSGWGAGAAGGGGKAATATALPPTKICVTHTEASKKDCKKSMDSAFKIASLEAELQLPKLQQKSQNHTLLNRS
jgi:hypothetical protein